MLMFSGYECVLVWKLTHCSKWHKASLMLDKLKPLASISSLTWAVAVNNIEHSSLCSPAPLNRPWQRRTLLSSSMRNRETLGSTRSCFLVCVRIRSRLWLTNMNQHPLILTEVRFEDEVVIPNTPCICWFLCFNPVVWFWFICRSDFSRRSLILLDGIRDIHCDAGQAS